MTHRKRIVIVGGGFGGLSAAQHLARADADIVVIDRRNHHLFQPLLYQVATATLSPGEVAWPIRHILRKQENARVLLATVTAIDIDERLVRLEDGTSEAYDFLIVATGAQHAYFGKDEWEQFAPGLKTLEDATSIRRKLLLAFEAAEREPDPQKRRALLTFAIIGAGPTGVEMAGAVNELGRASLKGQFRSIGPEDIRVVLIEGAERVLLNFDAELSAYTLDALRDLGVEVELGQMVKAIDANGVSYGDKRLETKTIIWAAGVAASPAAKWLGVEGDKSGRVPVNEDLTLPGHNEIFVIGDTASVKQPNGKPVPGVAPAAKQAGVHAARVILKRLHGSTDILPFAYKHAGDLATIGKSSAVIDFSRVKLKGWLAWWVWGIAHIYFLVDLKNRVFVALNWLWIYMTGQHRNRLITHGLAEARAPIKEVAGKG